MKVLWYAVLFFCLSDCMVKNEFARVIGQEISEVDKESMEKIENPADIKLNDTVAVSYNGCWIYARVQYFMPKEPLGYGMVNWCRANPDDYFGGRAINFKRHVRKLPSHVQQ